MGMSQKEFDRLDAVEFTVEEIHAAWLEAQESKASTADAIAQRASGGGIDPDSPLLAVWRRKQIVCRALGQMQDRALTERARQARKSS